MARTFAIGDIHGCLTALEALIRVLGVQKDDTLILLGDYIDRGPHSAGVIDLLISLQDQCQLVPILGNHDELLLQIIDGATWQEGDWLSYGGVQTLKSYGVDAPDKIPTKHIDFLRGCLDFFELEYHFFTHANYQERRKLEKTPPHVLRWESLVTRTPGPHISNKVAILGHTAQKSTCDILYLGHLMCIDTYCYGKGFLTAFDVYTGEYWQTGKNGKDVVKKRLS